MLDHGVALNRRVETYDSQLDHPQADSGGLRTVPSPYGDGELHYEMFAEYQAVYTRPLLCLYWRVTFIDRITGKPVYSFGDGLDEFSGTEYTQLIEIRQAAQQWVADVRKLKRQLRMKN